jgi:hypothetical protein
MQKGILGHIHNKKRFIVFWTVSCAFGFKLAKGRANVSGKFNMVTKRAEFDADIESIGKIARRGS